MYIIGISGKPGSQKFIYAFKIIQELRYHGYKTDVVSLAEPLYNEFNDIAKAIKTKTPEKEIIEQYRLGEKGHELLQLLDLSKMGEVYEYGYSRRNETVRKGLTFLGSEIRRNQDEDYFVKKLYARTLQNDSVFGVLTDLRYPNEADYITANNGLTIKALLVNDDTSGGFKYNSGREDPSETALDEYYRFYDYLAPQTYDRIHFAKTLLSHYDLKTKDEITR
jgi:hypothetical protein